MYRKSREMESKYIRREFHPALPVFSVMLYESLVLVRETWV